jgi:hypothetical protein
VLTDKLDRGLIDVDHMFGAEKNFRPRFQGRFTKWIVVERSYVSLCASPLDLYPHALNFLAGSGFDPEYQLHELTWLQAISPIPRREVKGVRIESVQLLSALQDVGSHGLTLDVSGRAHAGEACSCAVRLDGLVM